MRIGQRKFRRRSCFELKYFNKSISTPEQVLGTICTSIHCRILYRLSVGFGASQQNMLRNVLSGAQTQKPAGPRYDNGVAQKSLPWTYQPGVLRSSRIRYAHGGATPTFKTTPHQRDTFSTAASRVEHLTPVVLLHSCNVNIYSVDLVSCGSISRTRYPSL